MLAESNCGVSDKVWDISAFTVVFSKQPDVKVEVAVPHLVLQFGNVEVALENGFMVIFGNRFGLLAYLGLN